MRKHFASLVTVLLSCVVTLTGCGTTGSTTDRSKAASTPFQCVDIGGGKLVHINRTYVTDSGLEYTTAEDGRHRHKLRYLATVSCADIGDNIVANNWLFAKHRYSTTFIGRSPRPPIHTSYHVTTEGDVCDEFPHLNFFVSDVKANLDAPGQNPVLHNFFIWEEARWTKYASKLSRVRNNDCASDASWPKTYRLHIYALDHLNGSTDRLSRVSSQRTSSFRLVYSGVVDDGGGHLDERTWIDDDPVPRYEYQMAHKAYQERLAAIGEARREKADRFWGSIAALTIGYIQGISLEFADEGVCAFLSTDEFLEINKSQYVRCHNFLFDLYARIQASAPEAYLVANIFGMMNTGFESYIEQGESSRSRTQRRALAECLEGMASEYGRTRINERPDEKTLREACAIGAGMGAVRSVLD